MAPVSRSEAERILAQVEADQRYVDALVRQARRSMERYLAGH